LEKRSDGTPAAIALLCIMIWFITPDETSNGWSIWRRPILLGEEPMITSTVIVILLLTFSFTGNSALASGGGCGANFAPNVTYYAPYPWWWPQYFGPPHTDYQVVQYVTPPAESAAAVKSRIRVINAANPALLPMPSEQLGPPKQDVLPPPK
jgi:hypothetical protein